MDKEGQLNAAKFMIATTTADDEGDGNKDDVAVTKRDGRNPPTSTEAAEHNSAPTPVSNVANILPKVLPSSSKGKDLNEKKLEIKSKSESDTEELLGSLTTYNCHGTRTSARVIQKMRQDQQLNTRPGTPPPTDRDGLAKKDERNAMQKTPSTVRANRPTWSNLERNYFFDALNEFGKDFEAIGSFINSKLKRRCPATDVSFKSKDQVRQHYYQTYHKICKYIRFSEEVRKPAQELYALINYGEMRRKLQFVTDKHFMKLRNLVYHGHITVRCKGKNIRIKTPSCKALRRLNQLDDSLEDIRLPSKIEVIISPANMEAFGRVQTIAQNPRCRTIVPLHKKLINFIKAFQYKWRSMDMRIAEEAQRPNATTLNDPVQQQIPTMPETIATGIFQDPEICFLPKPNVPIHRPLLSITEYLSSVNICLTAYEERMGVKIKGETLNMESRHHHSSSSSTSTQSSNVSGSIAATCTVPPNLAPNKRTRTESGCEKKSPEQIKKQKASEVPLVSSTINHSEDENILLPTTDIAADAFQRHKNESSSDELSDELQELLSDCNNKDIGNFSKDDDDVSSDKLNSSAASLEHSANTAAVTNTVVAVPHRTIKKSFNTKASRSVVFKPLLNEDVLQQIRSGWTASSAGDITIGDLYVVLGHDSKLELDYFWTAETKSLSTVKTTTAESHVKPSTCSATECSDEQQNFPSAPSSVICNKLKQLLLIANLSERLRKRPCNCERLNVNKTMLDLTGRTYVANKIYSSGFNQNTGGDGLFRQPMIPIRRPTLDPVKQLTTLTRPKMSRQKLVQRLLLPGNPAAVQLINSNSIGFVGNGTEMSGTNTTSTTTIQQATAANDASLTTRTTATITSSQVPFLEMDTTTETGEISAKGIKTKTTTSSATKHRNKTIKNNPKDPTHTSNSSAQLYQTEDEPDCQTTQILLCSSSSSSPYSMQQQDQQQQFVEQNVLTYLNEPQSDPSSMKTFDSAFDECSNTSFLNTLSPMNLIRESSSNSRWLEENINDFSLTSLLGHLDEINASRDILDPSSSNISIISESSVDYMHKFQEIKALLQNQEKD